MRSSLPSTLILISLLQPKAIAAAVVCIVLFYLIGWKWREEYSVIAYQKTNSWDVYVFDDGTGIRQLRFGLHDIRQSQAKVLLFTIRLD